MLSLRAAPHRSQIPNAVRGDDRKKKVNKHRSKPDGSRYSYSCLAATVSASIEAPVSVLSEAFRAHKRSSKRSRDASDDGFG